MVNAWSETSRGQWTLATTTYHWCNHHLPLMQLPLWTSHHALKWYGNRERGKKTWGERDLWQFQKVTSLRHVGPSPWRGQQPVEPDFFSELGHITFPPPHIAWSKGAPAEPGWVTPGLPGHAGGSGQFVETLRLPESLKASQEDKHCPQNGDTSYTQL